jgi:poly-gamma-glutamate synthesis protein (capsule biosynthesis protein)
MQKHTTTLVWILVSAFVGIFIASILIRGAESLITQREKTGQIQPQKTLGGSIIDSLLPEIKKDTDVSLVFVGDIIMDRGVKTSVNNNFGGDFSKLFENTPLLKEADITFANFEGPVATNGKNVGSKWSFRMDPKTLIPFRDAGFDIVSFANNHVGDWTSSAFAQSLEHFTQNGIKYTGAGITKEEARQPIIIEKNNIKIGFIAFSDVGPVWMKATETTPGILLANDPEFSDIIAHAKTQVDILVVSFHWGEEYKPFTKRQADLAHRAVDNGADMVIGHHPHVIQATEWYKDKFIAYSLGNFIFDQYFSTDTMQGLVLEITLEKTGVKSVNYYLSKLNKQYQPIGLEKIESIPAITQSQPAKQTPLCAVGNSDEDKTLALVNQDNSVGEYIPKDLVPMRNRVPTKYDTVCLRKDTADNFEKMINAAQKDGIAIVITSGFRDKAFQKALYDDWIENRATPGAEAMVAKPTYSEHQLGTATDVTTPEIYSTSTATAFETTQAFTWLSKHADEYGFTLSYPKGKESVTGYAYEPWHWRYVGVDVATKLKDDELTFNEYMQ